jgi:hypothetical protein
MQDPARTTAPLRVVAVPSNDGAFVHFVQASVSPDLDIRTLELRLRRRYPRARVHPNDLSGLDAVWYAYRDGRWNPGTRSA